MRLYVDPPLSNEHCVCGMCGLNWGQELLPEETLWEVAIESNGAMKEGLARRTPLGWWAGIANGLPQTIPTVMMSSIGKTPFQIVYGLIKLHGIKLLGGAYHNPRAGGWDNDPRVHRAGTIKRDLCI